MKHNETINHDLTGVLAFGITPERDAEIRGFLSEFAKDIGAGMKMKRSEVIERVLNFSNSIIECMLIYATLELGRKDTNNFAARGVVIEGEVTGDISDLDEILKRVAKDIRKAHRDMGRDRENIMGKN